VKTELKRKPSSREIEEMCEAAQQAAVGFLVSKIPAKRMRDIEIVVEAIGDKPLTLNVEVSVIQSDQRGELGDILDEATRLALDAAESKARDLGL